jgi:glycosyltransferase involved in cell wall biosynthesis
MINVIKFAKKHSKRTIKARIIFFLPNFAQGGASESIVKLSSFLKNHNYSISLISTSNNFHKRYFKKIGCDVYELKKKRAFFSILALRKLIKLDIKKFPKVVIISSIHYANIISLISTYRLKNIKTILTERSSLSELFIYDGFFKYLKNRIIFFLVKHLYKYSDLIITNSKYEKRFIKKYIKSNQVKSIYPASIIKIKKNIKSYKNNNKSKKLIYVGRLSKEKGIITILKALNLLKHKLNFKLQIYGDGNEKMNIQKFITSNNLKKVVNLNGFYKDKKKIFSNADLFINASWFEGLPNALVQSINNNVFPICSKSPGGNIEVIKNGKLGLFFETNNSVILSKKILFFFKKNLKLNQSIRIKHLKNFTEEKSNKEYLKTLQTLK